MKPHDNQPMLFGAWTNELGHVDATTAATDTRLIGWGTGSVFNYFHHNFPLPLKYLADNDPNCWGDRRAGLTICSPQRLRAEDPERTLVIVYSGASTDIVRQLAEMGFPRAVAAGSFFGAAKDDVLRARLEMANRLIDQPVVREPETSRAIVVQGPIVPDMTPDALRLTAITHPGTLIVLSTWSDTSSELLDQLAPFVDDVVLTPPPDLPGIQNRNCQVLSTRAGIERARDLGARIVLKSRTDVALLQPDIFDARDVLIARYPAVAAQHFGLVDRLIVPASFTRKYLLYHPSDLTMLGAVEDLLTYWSAPLDLRLGRLEDDGRAQISLRDLGLGRNPTEAYLALHYCERIGWPVKGDVLDSWSVYRDLFAIVDNDWFGLLWLKNLAIADLDRRYGPRQLVDHAFWQRLVALHAAGDIPAPEVDPSQITLRHFGAAA